MPHMRRARGRESRARRPRKMPRLRYVSSGQRAALSHPGNMPLPKPQQRRKRKGDLKEFAFHRVTFRSGPCIADIGELLGCEWKKGHLFERGVWDRDVKFYVARERKTALG